MSQIFLQVGNLQDSFSINITIQVGLFVLPILPPIFSNCGTPNPLTVTSTTTVTDIQTSLPVVRPLTYSLDINLIRNNYGYTTGNSFYILVYGKDVLGTETYLNYQYFTVLDNDPAPTILGINRNESICANSAPIALSSSVLPPRLYYY